MPVLSERHECGIAGSMAMVLHETYKWAMWHASCVRSENLSMQICTPLSYERKRRRLLPA